MSPYEVTSVVMSVVSAAISLGALIFVGLQVRQGVRASIANQDAQEREWQLRRREGTLDFYLNTLERRRENQTLLPAPYNDREVEQFIEAARTDALKAGLLRAYLSDWELVATGVNLGVLDEDVVDRFIGTSAIATWQTYRGYAQAQRALRNEPSVYQELEQLAARLAVKRQSPRSN